MALFKCGETGPEARARNVCQRQFRRFVDALRELCGKVDGIEFSGFFVSMAGGEGSRC